MRKLILTTASVIALGLAAAGANAQQSTTAGPNSAGLPSATSSPNATTPGTMGNSNLGSSSITNPTDQMGQSNLATPSAGSQMSQDTAAPSRDMIRQAQEQLRSQGLYHGRIDGRLGPETKQALSSFQGKNGLQRTARLDQSTMDKLIGSNAGTGSSTPPADRSMGGTMQNNPHTGTTQPRQ